jgi:lysophospholipase L1-like esterase
MVDIAALSRPALLATGDTARIQEVFARARSSEPLTIAVIGGSITGGAVASAPTNSYGSRVTAWWRQAFPKAEIKFVNAGIGATGSDYGAFRARRDLLIHRPDFVVVEYAVNDPNTKQSAETLEGLLRQILKQPNQPAVVLLFMMSQGGNNAQEWHSKVGVHYGLPMISLRDALWPEIKAERLKWDAVMADVVHPNDLGHECAAGFITNLLEYVSKMPAPIRPIPAPLFTGLYEHVSLHEAADLHQPLAGLRQGHGQRLRDPRRRREQV